MGRMPMPRCVFHIATIILLFLLLQPAIAQTQPTPLEAKGFKGLLALSEDLAFYEKWKSPMIPDIRNAREVGRGKKLLVILTFANAGSDETGNGNVTFTFAMKRPDGTLAFQHKDVDALGKRPPAAVGMWMLSQQPMTISFDGEEPSGEYTFYATLTDHVKKATLPLTCKLQLQ
jgi:hypothetical protein